MRTESVSQPDQQEMQTEQKKVGRRDFTIGAVSTMAALVISPDEIFSQTRRPETGRQETDHSILRAADIFNANGTNVQMHFFYDDRKYDWDGHKSFRNMLKTGYGFDTNWGQGGDYQIRAGQNENWRIEDRGSFVHIVSVHRPKTIEIYANKPTHPSNAPRGANGTWDILEEFKRQEIEPHIAIHRAHNLLIHYTIPDIPKSVKLVILGSCQGDFDKDRIRQRIPNVQILAAEGIGSMSVTDPLLKLFNEDIILGQDLDWRKFWKKATGKLSGNPKFSDYRAPYQLSP